MERHLGRGSLDYAVLAFPARETDVMNAVGTWKDEEVFRCAAENVVLITSRNPGDLDAFNTAIAEEFGA